MAYQDFKQEFEQEMDWVAGYISRAVSAPVMIDTPKVYIFGTIKENLGNGFTVSQQANGWYELSRNGFAIATFPTHSQACQAANKLGGALDCWVMEDAFKAITRNGGVVVGKKPAAWVEVCYE